MVEGAVACLRCGDFVVPGALPLPGLELCAKCLEGERELPLPKPNAKLPRRVSRLQGALSLALALVGAGVGAWVGLWCGRAFASSAGAQSSVLPLGSAVACALLAGVCLGLMGLAVSSSAKVKRLLLEQHAVERAGDRFVVALMVVRPGPFFALRHAIEYGLFGLATGGVAFLGAEGTKCVVRFERVKHSGAVTIPWRSRQPFLELELTDGTALAFGPFKARLLKALVLRLNAGFAKRSKPGLGA